MTIGTRQFHNRIAVVFDFDDTLAPDSFEVLLNSWQLEKEPFFAQNVQPLLDDGWENILARFHVVIQTAQQHDDMHLTRAHLNKVGQQIGLFPGVPEMFDRVRSAAQLILPDVEIEFYLLTSGFAEIPRGTSIADEFTSIWGGEFAFAESGEAYFVKQLVTHPEKVRYLLQLAKGLESEGPNGPSNVYRRVPEEEWHVPVNQIVYVGDGASDMPVFRLMQDRGGIAIGVFKGDDAEDWRGYDNVNAKRRVENLATAGYAEDSELLQSIIFAVESIAKRLAVLRFSQGQ